MRRTATIARAPNRLERKVSASRSLVFGFFGGPHRATSGTTGRMPPLDRRTDQRRPGRASPLAAAMHHRTRAPAGRTHASEFDDATDHHWPITRALPCRVARAHAVKVFVFVVVLFQFLLTCR